MTHPAYPDAYLPRKLRHASIPVLAPVTEQVADVSDALDWPEINAAIDHARKLRGGQP